MPDWFVVNVADAPAIGHPIGGKWVSFESPDDRFPDVGISLRVVEPGQPSTKYHAERVQEDFLVLFGECVAIVEGKERRLRAWDFLHCPAGTEHAFVGAGEGPCAILCIGARRAERTVHYPVNEVAARHGASVAEPTSDPREAYADWGGRESLQRTRLDWPP